MSVETPDRTAAQFAQNWFDALNEYGSVEGSPGSVVDGGIAARAHQKWQLMPGPPPKDETA